MILPTNEELYYNNARVNEPLVTNVQQGLAPLYNEMLNPPTYGESTSNLQPMTLAEKKLNFQKNLDNKKQQKGIGNLLRTAVGFMIPGSNLIMGGGLQSLNQKIRGSDFGQATSLADYLDMQRYGGAQGRRDAAARTMAQARGLQNKMDQRSSATLSNRDAAMGGGSGGTSKSSNPSSKSGGFSSSERGAALHG